MGLLKRVPINPIEFISQGKISKGWKLLLFLKSHHLWVHLLHHPLMLTPDRAGCKQWQNGDEHIKDVALFFPLNSKVRSSHWLQLLREEFYNNQGQLWKILSGFGFWQTAVFMWKEAALFPWVKPEKAVLSVKSKLAKDFERTWFWCRNHQHSEEAEMCLLVGSRNHKGWT